MSSHMFVLLVGGQEGFVHIHTYDNVMPISEDWQLLSNEVRYTLITEVFKFK